MQHGKIGFRIRGELGVNQLNGDYFGSCTLGVPSTSGHSTNDKHEISHPMNAVSLLPIHQNK